MINVAAIRMQQFGVQFYQASLTASDIDKLVRFEVLSYGQQAEPAVLIRSDERKQVFTSKDGLELAGVSGPYGHFFMAGAVATMEAGADSGPKRMEHPGEELIFMLDGTMSFEVEGEEYTLRRGDALHFRTDRPHRWGNPSARPSRASWMALRST